MNSFRGTTPTQLQFGTSGLRGRVEDLTDLEVYINTAGFLDLLRARQRVQPGDEVFVAGDLRPSTHGSDQSIVRAVMTAVDARGLKPVYLGAIPTPALMDHACRLERASIMVTGSHIPFDRNGIKFNKPDGEVLKSDEAEILEAVARVRQEEYSRDAAESLFDDAGRLRKPRPELGAEVNTEGAAGYLERYTSSFARDALKGLRLVFIQHSAVGRELIPQILEACGAQVFTVGRSASFVPIDTEALPVEKLEWMESLTRPVLAEAGHVDAVVSTDGDSDRPLVLAPDAEGALHFVPGDLLGLLVADHLGADAVVTPISANDAIDRFYQGRDVRVAKTKIGSPHVIARMRELQEEGFRRVVGWEANGGFLLQQEIPWQNGTLRALATRDACLPLLAVLHRCRSSGESLLDLLHALPPRFGHADLIDDVAPALGRRFLLEATPQSLGIPSLEEKASGWVATAPAEGRGLSGGETNVLNQCTARLRSLLAFESFSGDPTWMNFLDGARIGFADGTILHFRPSGNAPQFRIYGVGGDARVIRKLVDITKARLTRLFEGWTAAIDRDPDTPILDGILENVQLANHQLSAGRTPRTLGIVAGSASARDFWQQILDQTRASFQSRTAASFHEDLPTNQAFGVLLLWQRLKPLIHDQESSMVAFVFGDGKRATPFTECESAQKPALQTFVKDAGETGRNLSMVELAMKHFVPVQQYLERSGFRGLVIKWGDEVQVPATRLIGWDSLFDAADVVRFVSFQKMTEATAQNKDWVGVSTDRQVRAFIARRPLSEMAALAEEGLIQKVGDSLFGGINLGSIAISYRLLDALLKEFADLVNQADANRRERPALDPEFFAALVMVCVLSGDVLDAAWEGATKESPDFARMTRCIPDVRERLLRSVHNFRTRESRAPRIVAMDFGQQYWGDVGQHAEIFQFYTDLLQPGDRGVIARAMAGIDAAPDKQGNVILSSRISSGVKIQNSVIIDADISGGGAVSDSVLMGTRCGDIEATAAFDFASAAVKLVLPERAGTYRALSLGNIELQSGERATSLILPDGSVELMKIHESTPLKGDDNQYERVYEDNPRTFAAAHQLMSRVSYCELSAARARLLEAVRNKLNEPGTTTLDASSAEVASKG